MASRKIKPDCHKHAHNEREIILWTSNVLLLGTVGIEPFTSLIRVLSTSRQAARRAEACDANVAMQQ
jgi:hypothetical protein